MRFPFMFRSDHEDVVRIMNVNLCSHQDTIRILTAQLIQKETEIDSLIQQLTTQTEQPAPSSKNKKDSRVHKPILGRSGWRARAESISRQTVPPVKDSAKALEEKVLKEGGTV